MEKRLKQEENWRTASRERAIKVIIDGATKENTREGTEIATPVAWAWRNAINWTIWPTC